jgi:DNA-binding transcriptional regulator YiaG
MDPEEFKSGRGAIGLTQTELARRLGVHPLTVSRWERGLVSIPNPVGKLMQVWVKAAGRRSRRKR